MLHLIYLFMNAFERIDRTHAQCQMLTQILLMLAGGSRQLAKATSQVYLFYFPKSKLQRKSDLEKQTNAQCGLPSPQKEVYNNWNKGRGRSPPSSQ